MATRSWSANAASRGSRKGEALSEIFDPSLFLNKACPTGSADEIEAFLRGFLAERPDPPTENQLAIERALRKRIIEILPEPDWDNAVRQEFAASAGGFMALRIATWNQVNIFRSYEPLEKRVFAAREALRIKLNGLARKTIEMFANGVDFDISFEGEEHPLTNRFLGRKPEDLKKRLRAAVIRHISKINPHLQHENFMKWAKSQDQMLEALFEDEKGIKDATDDLDVTKEDDDG